MDCTNIFNITFFIITILLLVILISYFRNSQENFDPTQVSTLNINEKPILKNGLAIENQGIELTKGTISAGIKSEELGTNDLGLYSNLPGQWNRYVTKDAPHKFFSDGGIGTNANLSIEPNGDLITGRNPIKFSSGWSGFPDDKTNGAEISNDTSNYKTLMIVGNKSSNGPRNVGIWDRLTVNGDLVVTGRIIANNGADITFGSDKDGRHRLALQGDKNMVLYDDKGGVVRALSDAGFGRKAW